MYNKDNRYERDDLMKEWRKAKDKMGKKIEHHHLINHLKKIKSKMNEKK